MRTLMWLKFHSNLKIFQKIGNDMCHNQSSNSSHSVDDRYKRAMNALNCLQSNKQVLADSASCQYAESKIAMVRSFFSKSGLDVESVEKKVSIIHVSGTKGKGSTCAYCESILRRHGYKTGLYSSPHLISVRETIRINGLPLSKQKFSDYFWDLYGKLCARENYNDTPKMPPYFTFLTIMAFKVFVEEKVDVAVVEVGIGGEYDCTNVLKNTPVVGITSIGYDHVKLLGNTIEEIAWQKAGIMKRDSIAITMSDQPPAAMKILREKAVERNCTLFVAANMRPYFLMTNIPLGISSPAQPSNASLGAQLANAWMNPQQYKKNSIMSFAPVFSLSDEICSGLSNCRWPGRTQILRHSNKLTFYLDGAHTCESMKNCVQWYMENITTQSKKVLVFNTTGNRNNDTLMEDLVRCQFDYAFFCPIAVDLEKNYHLEYAHQYEDIEEELEQSKRKCSDWIRRSEFNENNAKSFKNVDETFEYLKNDVEENHLHILVTGSLHLVGAFLSILDPDLNHLL